MVDSDSDSSDSSELNSSSIAEVVLVYVPLYTACMSGPDFDILVPGRLTLERGEGSEMKLFNWRTNLIISPTENKTTSVLKAEDNCVKESIGSIMLHYVSGRSI